MPDTKTELESIVSRLTLLADVLSIGKSLDAEFEQARDEVIEDMRVNFPGASTETLIRVAAFVVEVEQSKDDIPADLATLWGFSHIAIQLAKEL